MCGAGREFPSDSVPRVEVDVCVLPLKTADLVRVEGRRGVLFVCLPAAGGSVDRPVPAQKSPNHSMLFFFDLFVHFFHHRLRRFPSAPCLSVSRSVFARAPFHSSLYEVPLVCDALPSIVSGTDTSVPEKLRSSVHCTGVLIGSFFFFLLLSR